MFTTLGQPGRAHLDLIGQRIGPLLAALLHRPSAPPRRDGDPLAGLPPHIGGDIGLSDDAGRAGRRPAPSLRDLPSSAWPGRI